MQVKIVLEIGPKTRAIFAEMVSAIRAMDNRLTAALMNLPAKKEKPQPEKKEAS